MKAKEKHNHPLLLGESVKIEHMYKVINHKVNDNDMVNLFMFLKAPMLKTSF